MDSPDQRLFDEDLLSAEFRMGAAQGRWGVAPPEMIPADLVWPKRIAWIAAATRPNSPERYHLRLDLTGYRSSSPTGAFWNPSSRAPLPIGQWPKGKSGSRFAKVFRTDWNGAIALYHPFDRVAAQGHGDWAKDQPHLIWTDRHTIVDYLEEFHELLQGGDYLGV